MNQYPYAVCTECDWQQFYHCGDEHGTQMWSIDHMKRTGHVTHIKRFREFSDILFTRNLVINNWGNEAWEMHPDSTTYASALNAYDSGLMTLGEIETMRAMVYADSQAQQDHA
jgi:hypothetical protein